MPFRRGQRGPLGLAQLEKLSPAKQDKAHAAFALGAPISQSLHATDVQFGRDSNVLREDLRWNVVHMMSVITGDWLGDVPREARVLPASVRERMSGNR
jgi:hypothetical protein